MANSVPHKLGGARRVVFGVHALTSPPAWVPRRATEREAGASKPGGVSTARAANIAVSMAEKIIFLCKQVLSEDSTQLKLARLATRTAIARAP